MPLLDLSQTTVALQRLLQFNMPLLEPALGPSLSISTLPPEQVGGAANVLSLYCYHVSPDGSNRFRPRQSSGARPIASSPLTLVLNYILTAHTVVDSEFNALAEQRLLGYAMKTLHDYPVIDDSTRVDGQIVLPVEIRGQHNSFSVTQLQLTPGEALNFWANENQITVKPSCYYEVTAAEIEPEPPTRLPGRVLSIGGFVMPMNTPAISASTSVVHYTRPPSVGGGPATLTASPARVGPVTAAPPAVNVLTLTGRAFGVGTAQRLVLTHPNWARQFPGGRVVVDMGLNAAGGWAQEIAEDSVTITMGNAVRATPPGGGATVTLPLYPGLYLAGWEADRSFTRSDGSTAVLRERSNTCAFFVTPRIVATSRDGGNGRVTLDLGGDWLLTRGRPAPPDPTEAPQLDIQLSIDSQPYALDPGTLTDPGTFVIADHSLTYAPLAADDAAGEHAIRLVVDGADAQPFWVVIP